MRSGGCEHLWAGGLPPLHNLRRHATRRDRPAGQKLRTFREAYTLKPYEALGSNISLTREMMSEFRDR